MKRTIRRFSVLPVTVMILATGAFAILHADEESRERAALLLGNSTYRSSRFARLDTPPLDVQAMDAPLKDAGFKVEIAQNLTTAQMKAKIGEFTRVHREAGTLLIYYSGHGVQQEGENYLPGVDADLDVSGAIENLDRSFPGLSVDERKQKIAEVVKFNAGKQMLPLETVVDLLAGTAQGDGRVRMILLDACRSPFLISKGTEASKGLAAVNERPGLLIGFASAANQEAQQNEPGRPSLFTEVFATQMREPGLQLEQVFKRTSKAVTARSRALVKSGFIDAEQTPAIYSLLQDDFVFFPAMAKPESSKPAQAAVVSSLAPSLQARTSEGTPARSPLTPVPAEAVAPPAAPAPVAGLELAAVAPQQAPPSRQITRPPTDKAPIANMPPSPAPPVQGFQKGEYVCVSGGQGSIEVDGPFKTSPGRELWLYTGIGLRMGGKWMTGPSAAHPFLSAQPKSTQYPEEKDGWAVGVDKDGNIIAAKQEGSSLTIVELHKTKGKLYDDAYVTEGGREWKFTK